LGNKVFWRGSGVTVLLSKGGRYGLGLGFSILIVEIFEFFPKKVRGKLKRRTFKNGNHWRKPNKHAEDGVESSPLSGLDSLAFLLLRLENQSNLIG
jgi:hypothetical protein